MKKGKFKVKKRDLIEFGIVITIFGLIFFTNSQAEVFGRIQGVALKTGFFNAGSLDDDEFLKADYNFKLTDFDGKLIKGESLRGKTIFMNIWATWCPPCVAEMPSINGLYQDFKDNENVVFLLISEDRDFDTAKQWIERKELDLPIHQLVSPLPSLYKTGFVPSTFVISPEGKIVVRETGMANYDSKKFRKLLNRLDKQRAN